MRFGYSTNAFVKVAVFEAVERIARLGFRGVEIMCDRPHLYPADFDEPERLRLKDLIDSLDLVITNLNSFTLFAVGDTYLPSWIEPQESRRHIRIEHTIQCIELAAFLGCDTISVPPGGPLQGNVSREQAVRLFHHGLEQVVPHAESRGVRVLVEPEPHLLLENTREFRSFIRDMRSPVLGLNFDVGHFFCVGEDPCVAFKELREWIGHVHIEDIAADRSHNHLIPGLGVLPFLDVLETMDRTEYRGHISLELYPYVDMPDEAGLRGLEYLTPIFRKTGLPVVL